MDVNGLWFTPGFATYSTTLAFRILFIYFCLCECLGRPLSSQFGSSTTAKVKPPLCLVLPSVRFEASDHLNDASRSDLNVFARRSLI